MDYRPYGPLGDFRFRFRARPTRSWGLVAVDGDTLRYLELDQGMNERHEFRKKKGVRLLGVNAPEKNRAPSKVAGLAAKAFTIDWLGGASGEWPLVLETYPELADDDEETDNFGRWLAIVWRASDGACLNDALVAAGMAIGFMQDAGSS
jgi:endonuclease YncB( thermonuclease family)